MPTYDYMCRVCSFVNEYCTNKSMPKSMQPPEDGKCPRCGAGDVANPAMEKQFSPTGISFDVIGGYDYQYGKKAWKKNMNTLDQAKVLAGEKNPY